jgi:hypothetical protein
MKDVGFPPSAIHQGRYLLAHARTPCENGLHKRRERAK